MRDILKRIFIGVAIGMALFFLKTEVFALSWDLSEEKSSLFIFSSSPSINYTVQRSDSYSFVSKSFDTSFTNSNGYNFAVIPLTYNISYSNTGQINDVGGNLHNVFSSGLSAFIPRIVLVSNGSWSNCEIQNNLLICPLLKNLTYSSIRIYYNGSVYGLSSYTFNFTLNNTVSFYDLLSPALAIQQQTEDIQNTDSPADNTYNNDYSTSSFDSSSASVNQHTNIDVSSLNLDSSNYSSSWSWLWTTLESFIANTKVFLAYIFMLTLGFIALVLGR